jgi:hypothetical protein
VPKRKISKAELVRDIASGMDDDRLMTKYDLTQRALVKLMTKLILDGRLSQLDLLQRRNLIQGVLETTTSRLSPEDVLADLRAGVDQGKLREKYELSNKGLLRLLDRLVQSGVISHSELSKISPPSVGSTWSDDARSSVRAYVTIPIPVYDIGSATAGLLSDISVGGVRVIGIESSVGEVKTFQIALDGLFESAPSVLVGTCRWVTTRSGKNSYCLAGYSLETPTKLDDEAVSKLIILLLFTESGQWRTVK